MALYIKSWYFSICMGEASVLVLKLVLYQIVIWILGFGILENNGENRRYTTGKKE